MGWAGGGSWADLSPSLCRLWSWLNCSVNSVKDSSMVSVRGTDRERRRLKFFILFMVGRDQAVGPKTAERRRAGETRHRGCADTGCEFWV